MARKMTERELFFFNAELIAKKYGLIAVFDLENKKLILQGPIIVVKTALFEIDVSWVQFKNKFLSFHRFF